MATAVRFARHRGFRTRCFNGFGLLYEGGHGDTLSYFLRLNQGFSRYFQGASRRHQGTSVLSCNFGSPDRRLHVICLLACIRLQHSQELRRDLYMIFSNEVTTSFTSPATMTFTGATPAYTMLTTSHGCAASNLEASISEQGQRAEQHKMYGRPWSWHLFTVPKGAEILETKNGTNRLPRQALKASLKYRWITGEISRNPDFFD